MKCFFSKKQWIQVNKWEKKVIDDDSDTDYDSDDYDSDDCYGYVSD